MSSDHCPTVIQQTIPASDITALELLLLSDIFSTEKDSDGWYFYSDEGPSDFARVHRTELAAAITDRPDLDSEAYRLVAPLWNEPGDEGGCVEIDLSPVGWPVLFQDIVRRSATLKYVTSVAAFTSSRLSPDSLGGQALLITADGVRSKSTFDLLDEFLRDAKAVPVSIETDVLVELRFTTIRDRIRHLSDARAATVGEASETVTDEDIRAAIRAAIGRASFAEMQAFLEEHIASRAITAAHARLSGGAGT